MTIYKFDRYINGQLMAEGVTIEKAKSLEAATAAAARVASKGPNGEAPVLVLRREREPVKVKQLVWECFDAWTYWACCVVGTYRVQERNGVWKAILDDTNLIYEYTTDSLTPNDFEAAQLAAQSDYAARILAALEPDPTALTAIERAAYERGVQSALQHIRTWMELESEDRGEADAEYPLERQCAPILALLTQEGR